MKPTIAFINQSTVPLGFTLDAFIVAAQEYVDKWLVPILGIDGAEICLQVDPNATPASGVWPFYFMDSADVPGALAYHTTEDGLPIGKIFTKTTLDNGDDIGVSASHELSEALFDPLCDLAIQCGCPMPSGSPIQTGDIVPGEPADAVEEDYFSINGIQFSNFVTRDWFNSVAPASSKFDAMGLVTAPFQVRPGGYASLVRNGNDVNVFGSEDKAARWKLEDRRGHRIETIWKPKWHGKLGCKAKQ